MTAPAYDPTLVSVVTNAIGYSLYSEDGRPVRKLGGVAGVVLTPTEVEHCEDIALTVIDHINEYMARGGTW